MFFDMNDKKLKFLSIFEELCSIPHGSGNTNEIADYCVDFAKRRNLKYIRDACNNVVIYKDASAGYENAPAIILQGHLDMVCAKSTESDVDMEKESLKLALDGDWLYAKGTSLGGDNGIAIAMGLAILEDDTISHPPLEVVFTADEEPGMIGAAALDYSLLKSRRMINLDSEREGVFTVGCAGGFRAECTLPIERSLHTGVKCIITVNGLLGGHSGAKINYGRANAIILLGRVLYSLKEQGKIGVISFEGGIAENAIPSEASIELVVQEEQLASLINIIDKYNMIFKKEYESTDSGVKLFCNIGEVVSVNCFNPEDLSFLLLNLPNGVQAMCNDNPKRVQTSLNLGLIETKEKQVGILFSVRSIIDFQKEMLRDKLKSFFEKLGGKVIVSGIYPAWEYKKDSYIRNIAICSFWDLFSALPEVVTIHAGLECGLFASNLDGLDCISIGPDMKNVHTDNERLSVSSSIRTYKLLLEILKKCKN